MINDNKKEEKEIDDLIKKAIRLIRCIEMRGYSGGYLGYNFMIFKNKKDGTK